MKHLCALAGLFLGIFWCVCLYLLLRTCSGIVCYFLRLFGFLTGSFTESVFLCDLGSVSFCIAHPMTTIAVAWDMIMILAVVVMLLCCDV